MNAATPIPAPQGAVAWTPHGGWLRDVADMDAYRDRGDLVLVVSTDGAVHGVTDPRVAAQLRIDAEHDTLRTQLLGVFEDAAERLSRTTPS